MDTDGNMLEWRFTSPLQAHNYKPFVIDWGAGACNNTKHPSFTAPKGCHLRKLIFYSDNTKEVADFHRRIGLGGRVEVQVKESPSQSGGRASIGPTSMVAIIVTPSGKEVSLGG